MIDFDKLTLERIIFEVRYKGPLYIDRCGLVWRELQRKFPEMSPISVAPDGANFAVKSRATTIKLNASFLNITEDFPTSLTSMSEISDLLVPITIKHFELEVFERIGARFVFVLPVKEKQEADALLLSTGLIHISAEKVQLFGQQAAELGMRMAIQDENQGYTFNIASASREIEVNMLRPIVIDDRKFARQILIVDVDRFTRKSVAVGTVSASEFMRAGYKTIGNNLNILLRPEKQ